MTSGDDTFITSQPKWQVEEPLLSKITNAEQLEVIHRLETSSYVQVQGPPGTGKTHTIANLIGHLLATGRSVLVTSHTTKALNVLRDKVTNDLRPFCVAALDRSKEEQDQLREAVNVIKAGVSKDKLKLENSVRELKGRRQKLSDKITECEADLRLVVEHEYAKLSFLGITYRPDEAAQYVQNNKATDGWIPGQVTSGVGLPLSLTELDFLYKSNTEFDASDELELSKWLPATNVLLSTDDFAKSCEEESSLANSLKEERSHLWDREVSTEDTAEDIVNVMEVCKKLASDIETASSAEQYVLTAGLVGGARKQTWKDFIEKLDLVIASANSFSTLLLNFGPEIHSALPLEEQRMLLNEIDSHLEQKIKLTAIDLLFHPRWKKYINTIRISQRTPVLKEEFSVLRSLVQLQLERANLADNWDRLAASLGFPMSSTLPSPIEQGISAYRSHIMNHLEWRDQKLAPALYNLSRLGFRWDSYQSELAPLAVNNFELQQLKSALTGYLVDAFEIRLIKQQRSELKQKFELLLKNVTPTDGQEYADATLQLQKAVIVRDVTGYSKACSRIAELWGFQKNVHERNRLLDRLMVHAAAWAEQIRKRTGIHGKSTMPSDPHKAWLWIQLKSELDRRGQLSFEELSKKLETLRSDFLSLTNDLMREQTWLRLRPTDEEISALQAWIKFEEKIGKGTSKLTAFRQTGSRNAMKECKSAVPVWIMPFARAAESFANDGRKFDVVIIDEASQSDPLTLLAFYMGMKIVVVGDDKQVSPLSVGTLVDPIRNLISRHLTDIPHNQLYDGTTSVYDFASIAFGGKTITLLEHFRSVPEIIQFSNGLCYDYAMHPLRESAGVKTIPSVIAYHVEGGLANEKINQIEARTVASLFVAATEQPEYSEKSFGVICLVGNRQAEEVDKLLREKLSEQEYELRQVMCGNAAQFQGDERDIMLLSLVDSPRGGPLSYRAEKKFEQRFNVAASRARDQMWVVHSLDPRIDLKPEDLRKKLIEYAEDPSIAKRILESETVRAESPFEIEVIQRLIAKGYSVKSQFRVGYYRIDLVVEGLNNRLAIECDGGRYHPLEKIPEDMARQALLERLGWTFVRIRGSHFYRDKDGAMDEVFIKLSSAPKITNTTRTNNTYLPEYRKIIEQNLVKYAGQVPTFANYKSDIGNILRNLP